MIMLEKMRAEAGMSKSELARRSRIDISFICYAETRGFRLYDAQLRKIADAIGYRGEPADLLLDVDGERMASV